MSTDLFVGGLSILSVVALLVLALTSKKRVERRKDDDDWNGPGVV
ncbi:hypothetical protein [Sulfitobacter sabulilitoris]|nr:hypothetical protein [Sulfitobacter sabulilitoris]